MAQNLEFDNSQVQELIYRSAMDSNRAAIPMALQDLVKGAVILYSACDLAK